SPPASDSPSGRRGGAARRRAGVRHEALWLGSRGTRRGARRARVLARAVAIQGRRVKPWREPHAVAGEGGYGARSNMAQQPLGLERRYRRERAASTDQQVW